MFYSSFVICCTWFLAIIMNKVIARISSCNKTILMLIISKILECFLLLLLSYIDINNLIMVYIIISSRCMLDMLNRNLSIVGIKKYTKDELHKKLFSFYNSAKSLGTLTGGVLIIFIENLDKLAGVIKYNFILLSLASLLYILFIFFKEQSMLQPHKKTLSFIEFFQRQKNSKCLFYIIISNTFFFGFYQTSRIFLPNITQVKYNKIALLQIISTLGMMLGALYASNKDSRLLKGFSCIINIVIMATIGYWYDNELITIFVYFIFIFIYQGVYSKFLSVFLISAKEYLAEYTTYVNTLVTFFMITFIIIFSWLVGYLGYVFTSVVAAALCLLFILVFELLSRSIKFKAY